MKKILKPELVSPAGDWPSLRSAIDAGADAVYFGVKELNLRVGAKNFDILEIKKVMALLHDHGKKGYLTLNTIVYDKELPRVKKILLQAKACKVDAVMAWDLGVVQLAKELDVPVHLSTQASVSNFQSVKFFSSLGIKRIVLARECSISDIKEIVTQIKKEKIDCQIEAFIHGALCVSISGRCFFSQHLFGKSANRGECYHPCRREYIIKDVVLGNEYVLGKDYVLSAKDLCTIDFIDKLIEAGISAFKIEGRMRPPEYTSVVTFAYRKAIDSYFKGGYNAALKKKLRQKLETVFTRGFETGFYLGTPRDIGSSAGVHGHEKIFLGQVTNFYHRIGVVEVLLQSAGVAVADEILIFGKSTAAFFTKVSELQIKHKMVKKAPKGALVGIKVNSPAKPNDKVFLWRKKA
jgi:U32 family peptidase